MSRVAQKSLAARLSAATVTVPIPAIVVVILSLIAGGLQVVNQIVLKGHPTAQGAIAVFLIFVVALGIKPATGTAFHDLLKLPAWAYTLITAFIAELTGVLQIVGLSVAAHTIIATVLTVLAALGFAASPVAEIPAPAARGK